MPPRRSASAGRFPRRKGPDVWHHLNKLILLLIIIVGGALVGLSFLPEWRKQAEMRRNLAALEQRLEEEKNKAREQERQIFLLENDPEYVEIIARDKLDLMKEGETIFRYDPARHSMAGAEVSPTPDRRPSDKPQP